MSPDEKAALSKDLRLLDLLLVIDPKHWGGGCCRWWLLLYNVDPMDNQYTTSSTSLLGVGDEKKVVNIHVDPNKCRSLDKAHQFVTKS